MYVHTAVTVSVKPECVLEVKTAVHRSLAPDPKLCT